MKRRPSKMVPSAITARRMRGTDSLVGTAIAGVCAMATAAACGGTADSGSLGPLADARATTVAEGGSMDPPDATMTTAPGSDSGAKAEGDASDAGPTRDATADAGADGATLPLLPRVETCHALWPQTHAGLAPALVAVDPAGNAYFEVPFGGVESQTFDPPGPVDFGVPSKGYLNGFAVGKVDRQCHLVWVREFGGGTLADASTPGQAASSAGIAVDANGEVTLVGVFAGPFDLGTGTIASTRLVPVPGCGCPDIIATSAVFYLHLDTDGNVVVARTYDPTAGGDAGSPSFALLPLHLGIDGDGNATAMFLGTAGANFGSGVITGGDPTDWTHNEYLFRFDASGNMTLARMASPVALETVAPAPSGAVWTLGGVLDADGGRGLTNDAGNLFGLMQLDADGGVVSLTQSPDLAFLAASAHGEVASSADHAGSFALSLFDTTGAPVGQHATPLQSTFADVPSEYLQQLVLDGQERPVIGFSYDPLYVSPPAGGASLVSPGGAGYAAFDEHGVLIGAGAWGDVNTDVLALSVAATTDDVVLAGRAHTDGGVALYIARLPRDAGTVSDP
jgi:hypothetical protein